MTQITYTVYDISKLFCVTDETVRRWIRNGQLKTNSLSSKKSGYKIKYEHLKAFVDQQSKLKFSFCEEFFHSIDKKSVQSKISKLEKRINEITELIDEFNLITESYKKERRLLLDDLNAILTGIEKEENKVLSDTTKNLNFLKEKLLYIEKIKD